MKKIVFVILTVFVLVASIEFALRLVSLTKSLVTRSITRSSQRSLFQEHPFLTITMAPNYTGIKTGYHGNDEGRFVFQTNTHGFRTRHFEIDKPKGVFRTVMLGGSALVTGGDTDSLISACLEKMVPIERKGLKHEVINAGVPYYTSTQELFLLITKVLDWNPDRVVFYHGRNDIFCGSLPRYEKDILPHNRRIIELVEKSRMPPLWTRHFFLLHLLKTRMLARECPEPENVYDKPDGARYVYNADRRCIDVYRRNLSTALAALSERDIETAVFFQPSVVYGSKKLSAREQEILKRCNPKWVLAMRKLYPLARDAAEETCMRFGVPFADLAYAFKNDAKTRFMDDVHQTDNANRILAKKIGETLERVEREVY